MTTCTITPTVAAPSLGARVLEAAARYFSRSVMSREAIDQAWFDSGLHRLNRATLEDIGAPPELVEQAERREAWKLASSLDATRLL
jgi:hypothetical protein